MSGARTEPPSPRRLAEARRRGQVAVSRELTSAVALAAGAGTIALRWPATFGALAGSVRRALAAAPAATGGLESTELRSALAATFGDVARLAGPPVLAAALAGGAAGLLQTRALLAPGIVSPRPDRLHPGAGLRRLLGREHLAATGLALAKLVPAAILAVAWLRASWASVAGLPRTGAASGRWPALLAPLAVQLLVLLAALGALDLLLARRRHRRALALTREEMRRDQKEDEGDPAHRGERRRRHRDLALAGPVASASCVLVNPTRLAVALRHQRGQGAPRVVAKGRGAAARRIRSAARLAGIPIVREVGLARALHRQVEVGEEIPEALYDAAAAVLAHLGAVAGEGAVRAPLGGGGR